MTYVDPNRNNGTFLTVAVPLGVTATAASIATRALVKENRADTFVNSAKKCAKVYTAENRLALQNFCKNVLKWDRAAEYLGKLSNKKMFGGLVGASVLGASIAFQAIGSLFKRN